MIEVILLEPENEGNVGAVSRAMANFGFDKLIVVNPKCKLDSDEFFKRAKHSSGKVTVKAVKKIPKYDTIIGTTAKVNTDYNVERSPIFSYQLADKIMPYAEKSKIGLLFGREGIGLTNEEIHKCDYVVTINAAKEYGTLNLSHAVAIVLYELHKKIGKSKIADDIEPARDIDKNQVMKMINSLITKFDFKSPYKKELQRKMWRNIMNKSMMTKREAFGIMGLLSKLNKKLK
jgi:tRNA/rRNA methyltransferase